MKIKLLANPLHADIVRKNVADDILNAFLSADLHQPAQELKEGILETISSVKINLKRPLGILYPKGKVFTNVTRSFFKMMTGEKPGRAPAQP